MQGLFLVRLTDLDVKLAGTCSTSPGLGGFLTEIKTQLTINLAEYVSVAVTAISNMDHKRLCSGIPQGAARRSGRWCNLTQDKLIQPCTMKLSRVSKIHVNANTNEQPRGKNRSTWVTSNFFADGALFHSRLSHQSCQEEKP